MSRIILADHSPEFLLRFFNSIVKKICIKVKELHNESLKIMAYVSIIEKLIHDCDTSVLELMKEHVLCHDAITDSILSKDITFFESLNNLSPFLTIYNNNIIMFIHSVWTMSSDEIKIEMIKDLFKLIKISQIYG